MERLDAALVSRGLVSGRDRAADLCRAGRVKVNGTAVLKPAAPVSETDELEADDSPYVSRGGIKLAWALKVFGLDVRGMNAVDLGASTGGFTDCLLQSGAAHVWAVDVGHGQLAEKLRSDPRVTSMEGVNARTLTVKSFPKAPDLVTADLSFISLKLVYPVIAAILAPSGRAVTLIKPQFEAGRAAVGHTGVVRDKVEHVRVLKELEESAVSSGLYPQAVCVSPIRGQEGNVEYLAYYTRENIRIQHDYAALVRKV